MTCRLWGKMHNEANETADNPAKHVSNTTIRSEVSKEGGRLHTIAACNQLAPSFAARPRPARLCLDLQQHREACRHARGMAD